MTKLLPKILPRPWSVERRRNWRRSVQVTAIDDPRRRALEAVMIEQENLARLWDEFAAWARATHNWSINYFRMHDGPHEYAPMTVFYDLSDCNAWSEKTQRKVRFHSIQEVWDLYRAAHQE